MPKVSVIMPAFNAEKFIGHAIKSVLMQSMADLELIVINDGSRDGTSKILEEMRLLHPRIKVVNNKCSVGPASARNIGLDKAQGEFIAFIDSDDEWMPHKLESQVEMMECERLKMSYTSYRRCNKSLTHCSRVLPLPKHLDYKTMLIFTGIAGCLTVVVRRDFLGPKRFPTIGSEDLALWLELLRDGSIAKLVPGDLARYRVTSGSVSSNKFKTAMSVWKIYRLTEAMGFLRSSFCMVCYIFNALKQRCWL